ncbi:MAG TPA: hypothetical protein VGC06_32980, partial [Actinomycetes bacterium]
KIYFCDPHSPWQRPTNENTNGLLRDCQISGVTGLAHLVDVQLVVLGVMRPSKVMTKAFSAGFHRIIQRFRPLPVGSSDRVTR